MDAINHLLSLQLSKLSELDSLLDEEKDLLAHRDVDSLMQLVMRKKDLLDKIALNDEQLKQHPDSSALTEDNFKEQVESLKTMLASCQKKSAVNEEIVNQSLNSMERLGKVLTEVRSNNLTYDASANKVSLTGNSIKNLKA
jgi:flagellar biosynthesis/type III secretory pathway chaperone